MSTIIHASIFLVNEKNEVLVVREGKEKVFGLLNLPGGKMEHGETVVAAAIRETKEETGLLAHPSHLIGVYTSSDQEDDYVHFVFLSRDYSGEFPGSDPTIQEAKWMAIEHLQTLGEAEVLNVEKIRRICLDYRADDLPSVDIIK